jgi:hypothetical protein
MKRRPRTHCARTSGPHERFAPLAYLAFANIRASAGTDHWVPNENTSVSTALRWDKLQPVTAG